MQIIASKFSFLKSPLFELLKNPKRSVFIYLQTLSPVLGVDDVHLAVQQHSTSAKRESRKDVGREVTHTIR